MSISIYLILLIVLLLFNLVFWVLVIWFRILFDCDIGKCCSRSSDESDIPTGHRNLGFIDSEDFYNNRPSTISERMESPPSYEDALKFEQFGFHSSPPVYTSSQSSSTNAIGAEASSRLDASHQSTSVNSAERSTVQLSQSPPRLPEVVRSRSSTSASNSMLAPITEEELDEMPVTVVIDCIGVQASRLLENCDTRIDISNGENLNDHSKC